MALVKFSQFDMEIENVYFTVSNIFNEYFFDNQSTSQIELELNINFTGTEVELELN